MIFAILCEESFAVFVMPPAIQQMGRRHYVFRLSLRA